MVSFTEKLEAKGEDGKFLTLKWAVLLLPSTSSQSGNSSSNFLESPPDFCLEGQACLLGKD